MKRVFGLIFLAVGVMLLVLAPLLKFYVTPSLAVAPLDQYSESLADVSFAQIVDPVKLASGDPDPYERDFEATQYIFVRGDVPAAEQPEAEENNLAVYDYFMRVDNNDTGDLVTSSTARYAFDRTTSELDDCCGANVNEDTADFSGILPVKFPFFAEQTDYQFFNSTIKAPAPAVYQGEEEKFGINTYVYQLTIPPTPIASLEVPTSAIPGQKKNAEGNTKLVDTYSTTATYYVEPTTGQIVYGESKEYSTINTEDGEELFVKADYTGRSNEEAAAAGAESIQSDADALNMVGSTAPLVLGLLGILLLVIGLLMLRKPKPAAA